jgi:hypothetical protein
MSSLSLKGITSESEIKDKISCKSFWPSVITMVMLSAALKPLRAHDKSQGQHPLETSLKPSSEDKEIRWASFASR